MNLYDLQKALVKRLYSLFTIKDSAAHVPRNLEARRRLQFFTNSLFMDVPPPKSVRKMLSFRYFFLHTFIILSKQALHKLTIFLPILFSVSSLHIILRLCYTAWLNSLREMRMEYQSCFTFRKYIQVYWCEFLKKISDSCLALMV